METVALRLLAPVALGALGVLWLVQEYRTYRAENCAENCQSLSGVDVVTWRWAVGIVFVISVVLQLRHRRRT